MYCFIIINLNLCPTHSPTFSAYFLQLDRYNVNKKLSNSFHKYRINIQWLGKGKRLQKQVPISKVFASFYCFGSVSLTMDLLSKKEKGQDFLKVTINNAMKAYKTA